MYNGIGLLTPRGSGTSGHVQNNAFNMSSASAPLTQRSMAGPTIRKPNEDILEHNRKRELELKLAELEDELEDKGYAFCAALEALPPSNRVLRAWYPVVFVRSRPGYACALWPSAHFPSVLTTRQVTCRLLHTFSCNSRSMSDQ